MLPHFNPQIEDVTVAEIDLAAFHFNVKQLKKKIVKSLFLAVIKTNAYGHGIVPIAKEAIKAGADRLGVTSVNEAVTLRKNGVNHPIQILSAILPSHVKAIVHYRLISSISSEHIAKALSQEGAKQNKTVKVHLKLDTGLHRFGMVPDYIMKLCENCYSLPFLNWEGIYTHFSCADEGDWVTTEKQYRLFLDTVNKLKQNGYFFPLQHVGASTVAIERSDMHKNMVRPGIALFGYQPDERQKKLIDLKPVMTLKTKIVQLHQLPASTKIGYGGTYETKQDEKIAIIPIGHGDGYKRGLSNKGYVLVRGKYAKVVGTISLDQTFINVTNIPNVQEGDEVILIGTQGDNTISARDIAKWIQSNVDEILASIMQRINRIYIYREKEK
ncbi:alanine racemase [Oceanobacillus sp. Castelsardo]|uniref:alanine racemase n=1 Tax=Oceanobacillus sp. Castelsardo TaxID=1851204 RepID=UPI0008390D93|nr:alanine racemase [Oceanobacillus sp. Castelsardo]